MSRGPRLTPARLAGGASAALAASVTVQRAAERWLVGGATPAGERIDVLGHPTHVVVDGPATPVQGRPVVVFVNALCGAWFDWDLVMPLLPATITTVRFDRPGLGWTPGPSSVMSLERETDRIAAVVRTVARDAPVVLVGWSYGGFLAQALARRLPSSVTGMVLVDSSAIDPAHRRRPEQPTSDAAERRQRKIRSCARAAIELGLGAPLGLASRRVAFWVDTHHAGDPSPADARRAVYGNRRAALACVDELVSFDRVEAQLVALERSRPFPPIPLRILTGDGSRFPRRGVDERWRSQQRSLLDLSPGAQLRSLPDAAHAVPADRPDAVADAIVDVVGLAAAPAVDP